MPKACSAALSARWQPHQSQETLCDSRRKLTHIALTSEPESVVPPARSESWMPDSANTDLKTVKRIWEA